MGYGVHEVPEEFRDEDKWLYLTKRQWAIILPAVALAVAVVFFVISTGLAMLLPLVIIVMMLLLFAAAAVALFELPEKWYLIGNRVKIEKVAFRYLKKKWKSKKVYTKHHDNGYREW